MKATGIVRRIDDLGRVVIPKEIRRTMRIREGDPLEIYTDREGEVIFKKYSPIGELANFAGEYAETLHKVCGISVLIFDRDAVIATAGVGKREYQDRKMSEELEEIAERRQFYSRKNGADKVFPMLSTPIEKRWEKTGNAVKQPLFRCGKEKEGAFFGRHRPFSTVTSLCKKSLVFPFLTKTIRSGNNF